jgi:hypothetical protein
VTARYFLAELDAQTELLRVLMSETRRRPKLLNEAVDQLIASTFEGFGEWLGDVAGGRLSPEKARIIATLALGALLSTRLLRNVLGVESLAPDDDEVVEAWVEMVYRQLDPHPVTAAP